MSAPSSTHARASFAFVTPQILICIGFIIETTNGRAFGRARHSVTAVPGCWMPLGRAARECRPYLSSAQVQHCRASVSDAMAFHRNALQHSHHSLFALWPFGTVALGCRDQLAQTCFRIGRSHERCADQKTAEAKRPEMAQRLRVL